MQCFSQGMAEVARFDKEVAGNQYKQIGPDVCEIPQQLAEEKVCLSCQRGREAKVGKGVALRYVPDAMVYEMAGHNHEHGHCTQNINSAVSVAVGRVAHCSYRVCWFLLLPICFAGCLHGACAVYAPRAVCRLYERTADPDGQIIFVGAKLVYFLYTAERYCFFPV